MERTQYMKKNIYIGKDHLELMGFFPQATLNVSFDFCSNIDTFGKMTYQKKIAPHTT